MSKELARDIRDGILEAKAQEGWNPLVIQGALASIIAGGFSRSWWIGLGSFVLFLVLLLVRPLALVLCVFLSLLWGAFAGAIGHDFGGSGSAWVCAIIGFVIGLGANLGGLDALRRRS